MVVVSGFAKILGTEIRKKIGNQGDPDPENVNGIYQVRTRFGRRTQVKEVFYTPTNPQTPAQQANRQKYADGVVAWQALTPAQKAQYNKDAIGKHMSGYNLFLKQYLLS